MKLPLLIILAGLCLPFPVRAAATNLITNGSFERSDLRPGLPDHWSAAGNAAIRQKLGLDTGRNGQRSARLECTEYAGDGPDFHVMICQVGQTIVRRGQWYRLSFWAKGEGIKSGAVEVSLVNMRPWDNVGLADAFTPRSRWEHFEFRFRAKDDLPAANSRLQFWFKSLGTLWLDDVELVETNEGQEWFPQIATQGVKNFVPNSSFECGRANWGGFTYGLSGWAGNLYRLEGELDRAVAQHGGQCLKIALAPETLPVFWFDYYEPVRQPVRRVLAANRGWFRVKPGEPLTLSAFLRADVDGVVAQLAANQAPTRLLRKAVTVGPQWQRYEFSFAPTEPFLFIAVGLDLEASQRPAATLWVDAVQLERGERASAYEPRQTVESFLEADVLGHIFTDVQRGADLVVRAFNNSDRGETLRGRLTVTDFFNQTVFERQASMVVPPHSAAQWPASQANQGRRGFFLGSWTPAGATVSSATSSASADSPGRAREAVEKFSAMPSFRFAVLEPPVAPSQEAPFGFNHAYPWDFLVRLAHQAGVTAWRDWSAKWQTVEPKKGQFDFAIPDAQIHRVLRLGGEVEVLLPFPSTSWSTTARSEEVEKAAGKDGYLRTRLPLAYAPRDLNDFGRYAAEVVRHYRQSQPRGVTTYQVLNEPVYTSYALPRQFGYTLDDYLRLLEVAYRSMKTADPPCRVVGGISAGVSAGWTRDFVAKGGLRFLDVLDLHVYDPPRPAEQYEDAFRNLAELMRAHGGPKPIWITEWGCYADDDPPCVPHTVGDATMNRCRWPNERAATEHIVKFAAVTFAHGLRKIYFHAGTCGPINGPDAGGVLFEYGGTPRRMYAGVAAFSRLLGVPDEFIKKIERGGSRAYLFRSHGRVVAVAWGDADPARPLVLPVAVQAHDVMGNRWPNRELLLTDSPVYLISAEVSAVEKALSP